MTARGLVVACLVAGGCYDPSFLGTLAGDGDAGPPLDLAATDQGTPAVPRLLAPLSSATVTRSRPTLHWTYGPGAVGTQTIELCDQRTCALIHDSMTLPAGQTRVTFVNPLPSQWVFWRVWNRVGDQSAVSTVWQFYVGIGSASSPVDSSRGSVLDVNGDGMADFLIGARGDARAYLYLGGAFTNAPLELIGPDGPSSQFGYALASAGDVNGDGFADFLVTALNVNTVGTMDGTTYLYLGSAAPSASAWNRGTGRIQLQNSDGANATFGAALAGAGDLDGDGYGDFVIGAPAANRNRGAANVYFGSVTPSDTDWSGSRASRRVDLSPLDTSFGSSVAGVGDVNGDGYGDFLVGAGQAAVAHVYFGGPPPTSATWDASASASRVDIAFRPPGSGFGAAAAGAGDVNGDGFSDFVVGAYADAGTGSASVFFGSAAPKASDWSGAAPTGRIDLTSPEGNGAMFGWSVAGAGDINFDGYDDLVVGLGGTVLGGAHVYYGGASPAAVIWNASSTPGRFDLVTPDGANALFGYAVAVVGDIEGRTRFSFLVGDGRASGGAHLYRGTAPRSYPDWNSPSALDRVDLPNPGSATSFFGSALH